MFQQRRASAIMESDPLSKEEKQIDDKFTTIRHLYPLDKEHYLSFRESEEYNYQRTNDFFSLASDCIVLPHLTQ